MQDSLEKNDDIHLDNCSSSSIKYLAREKQIKALCEKYKFQYNRYNHIVTIKTVFSEWYFNINGSCYKLRHKNNFIKGGGKWSEEYHNQKQHPKFKAFVSIFKYIKKHDENKYIKPPQYIGRLEYLISLINHVNSDMEDEASGSLLDSKEETI